MTDQPPKPEAWRSRNPYGVGMSGQRVVQRPAVCGCCDLRFLYRTPETAPQRPPSCPDCEGHPGADPLQIAIDHGRLYRARADRATTQLKAEAERREEAERELKRAREAVAAALSSRDRYRAVFRGMWERHRYTTDGTCACGQTKCPEQQALHEAERAHNAHP